MKNVKKEEEIQQEVKLTGIELNVGQVISCLEGLRVLNERSDSKGNIVSGSKLPAKIGYWVGRLEDKLLPIEKQYNENRKKLVKKWGTLMKNSEGIEIPGQYKVAPEHVKGFNDDLDSVLEQQEIIDFKKMDFQMFEGDGIEQLSKLFWSTVGIFFINEPKEK